MVTEIATGGHDDDDDDDDDGSVRNEQPFEMDVIRKNKNNDKIIRLRKFH